MNKNAVLLRLIALSTAFVLFLTGCGNNVSAEPKLEYTDKFEMKQLKSIGNGQDGDIYGGYIFNFTNDGKCYVYAADDCKYINKFTLDKADVLNPHANSVQFSSVKYEAEDEFPLLYVNIYNNYSKEQDRKLGTCLVYRLERYNDIFITKLLQVIKVGFAGASEKWPDTFSTPYGNFNIDTDNNKLYSYVMRGNNGKGVDTIFFEFDLPDIDEGRYDSTYECNVVTLKEKDIEDEFVTEFFHWVQGACYNNGKLFVTEGFGKPSMLRVVDLKKKKVVAEFDFEKAGYPYEPEMVSVYKGELYVNFMNGDDGSFFRVEFG